ncbi:dihydroxyacetone kinase subunit DhaK [Streptosporangium amethystogenes]|uniref:dihydroxyacetone kinase subunit DhaK n=1 Tax=Streptosporangium amethystogenes TaxID=2002 RepID=UPI0004C5D859|nr:dihydroxyacetone kinase subunit DhaK [Streptosporangium amethystogenes]
MAAHQLVNDPQELVGEALEGLELSQRGRLRWNRDPSFVIRADDRRPYKVGVLSGGGSGHEPLHTGFVGYGMLDAAVPGAVFASPTAIQIQAATEAVDDGRGVVHVVKNYTGDVLNFTIAAEISGDIRIETVLVDDDLATDTSVEGGPGRRGTAAVVAVEKICGAAAERGADLSTVATLGRRVAGNARTMSLALRACTHPGQSVPSFDLEAGQVEFGVGIHGERGVRQIPVAPADELVAALTEPVADDLGLSRGDAVFVIVNGLGSTHQLELLAAYRQVTRLLDARGVTVARQLVGSYVTALDMAGCSVTLIRADEELVGLWDDPVRTAALTW